jgi:hypothetical protein
MSRPPRELLRAVREWGSTEDERRRSYPCDSLLRDADHALFRAVDIAAPAATVFRWLCQLKVAPYSYDWIDNAGRQSPQALIDGLDRLEVGQRFMTIFELREFEAPGSITLWHEGPVFGRVAVTYHVEGDGNRSRLLVKLLVADPRGPLGLITRHVLPAGDLVMMRRQLRNLKALAEADPAAGLDLQSRTRGQNTIR